MIFPQPTRAGAAGAAGAGQAAASGCRIRPPARRLSAVVAEQRKPLTDGRWPSARGVAVAGSVTGGPHFLEELVGLADAGRGGVDVVAVRGDGLGGGGHLVGGAVVG